MQLRLVMVLLMMSLCAHQLQFQMQTQIEATIQRALAEKLPHTLANIVFEPVRPGGSNHCVVSSHSEQPRRKITHSGSRSYSPDFGSEEASSHSEDEDGYHSYKRRRTADPDNCSDKSNQPDDDRVEVMFLLMRSFWRAMKIIIKKKKQQQKTSNVPGFNDFHKEVPGVNLSESTVEW